MAYSTNAELQARFEDDTAVAHLTDTETTGTPDDAVLTECRARAEGLVNSKIGTRYAVPIGATYLDADTELAGTLRSACLDLAVRHLHERTGRVPQSVTEAADRVLAWLDDIVEGKAVLPYSGGTLPSTDQLEPDAEWGQGVPGADSTSSKRVFSRDSQDKL